MILILIRCVFLSSVRCYLQVFPGLHRVNREISNKRFFGKGGKRQGKKEKRQGKKKKAHYKFLINYYFGLFTNFVC